MLEAFEIAMTPQGSLPPGVDHIAVGIQPRRFGGAIKAAEAHVPWDEDPRLNWMATAIKATETTAGTSLTGAAKDVITTIRQAPDHEHAIHAATEHLTNRLARLLMIEADSVRCTQKSVADHGLDSMIGAEFRNWIFREFKVDVPFQQLLAGSLTVSDLARELCARIKELEC